MCVCVCVSVSVSVSVCVCVCVCVSSYHWGSGIVSAPGGPSFPIHQNGDRWWMRCGKIAVSSVHFLGDLGRVLNLSRLFTPLRVKCGLRLWEVAASPYSLSPDGKGGREVLHHWPEPDACLLDPTCRGWCFYMQLGQNPATQRPGFSAAPGMKLNVLPIQRK